MRHQKLIPGVAIAMLLSAGCGDEERKRKTARRDTPVDEPRERPGKDHEVKLAASVVDCVNRPADLEITILDRKLSVDPAVITVGQTIRWSNADPVTHTVTEGSVDAADAEKLFNSADLHANESVCIQFNKPGYYSYYCDTHKEDTKGGGILVEKE